jgi:hypothetical protein
MEDQINNFKAKAKDDRRELSSSEESVKPRLAIELPEHDPQVKLPPRVVNFLDDHL